MTTAISTFSLSPSSSIARSFLNLLGVTPSPHRVISESPIKSAIEDMYTEQVQEYARENAGWAELSDLLYVTISNDGKISIEFDGSEEDELLINALEYGGPSNPPAPVIRIMEERLRQDYLMTKQRFGL